jgi:hypothetical protein
MSPDDVLGVFRSGRREGCELNRSLRPHTELLRPPARQPNGRDPRFPRGRNGVGSVRREPEWRTSPQSSSSCQLALPPLAAALSLVGRRSATDSRRVQAGAKSKTYSSPVGGTEEALDRPRGGATWSTRACQRRSGTDFPLRPLTANRFAKSKIVRVYGG